MASELLSANEAGKVLGITGRRVRHLVDTGAIPALRVGKSYVIKRADLAGLSWNRKTGRPRLPDSPKPPRKPRAKKKI